MVSTSHSAQETARDVVAIISQAAVTVMQLHFAWERSQAEMNCLKTSTRSYMGAKARYSTLTSMQGSIALQPQHSEECLIDHASSFSCVLVIAITCNACLLLLSARSIHFIDFSYTLQLSYLPIGPYCSCQLGSGTSQPSQASPLPMTSRYIVILCPVAVSPVKWNLALLLGVVDDLLHFKKQTD